MKHLAAIAAVAVLASCTKEQDVTYTATCDRCYVWYVSGEKEESAVAVVGRWNVWNVDTIVAGMDTLIVRDSSYVLGAWSASTTITGDYPPSIRARNEYGSAITTIDMNGRNTSTSENMGVVFLK